MSSGQWPWFRWPPGGRKNLEALYCFGSALTGSPGAARRAVTSRQRRGNAATVHRQVPAAQHQNLDVAGNEIFCIQSFMFSARVP